MCFFINFFKGIAIGAGAILPGISSGVICVILGLYEKLLNSILNLFYDFKKNVKFLSPIILGSFFSIILFSKVLSYLLTNYSLQTKSIFIGLILGSLPFLIKEIKMKEKLNIKHFIFFMLSLSIGILSIFLEKYLSFSSSCNINSFYLIICGFFMSIGVVVPGISSTVILMLLGIYSVYLSSLHSMYLPVLLPMGMGLIIGGFIFMKITQFLLNYFYSITFSCIIGFTIGSIFILLPSITSFSEFCISILSVILGLFIFNIFKFKT